MENGNIICRRLQEDVHCITELSSFVAVVLNPESLHLMLMELPEREDGNPPGDVIENRYGAYRRFVAWLKGRLRRKSLFF